jgi:hypothetical protein
MSTVMTVPVTIAPEARAFIDMVGQREEFELMIDKAKHFVPRLSSIEVALDEATEDMPPGVILWTHRDDVGTDDDPTHRSWIEWMAATFPPEVCENFVLLPVYCANGR